MFRLLGMSAADAEAAASGLAAPMAGQAQASTSGAAEPKGAAAEGVA